MTELAQLRCAKCSWQSVCGPAQMLDWLRGVKMVRRDTEPEPALVGELFGAAASRFTCPHCQAVGLAASAAELGDDEAWAMARACEGCGRPIPFERLEVFPDTRLCVVCQAKNDRGEAERADQYCPRCGGLMKISQTRRGVTRYVLVCPKCRR